MSLPAEVYQNRKSDSGQSLYWDTQSVHEVIGGDNQSLRSTERLIEKAELLPPLLKVEAVRDEEGQAPAKLSREALEAEAKRKRWHVLVIQAVKHDKFGTMIFANDPRMARRWVYVEDLNLASLKQAMRVLADGKTSMFWPHGEVTSLFRQWADEAKTHDVALTGKTRAHLATVAYASTKPVIVKNKSKRRGERKVVAMSHLDQLEAESIHIMREVVSQAENPVMMYSVGKDSSVMVHLAKKAFYPSPPPFPLMHVDTRWKFQAMYSFREAIAKDSGMDLITHINPEGVEKDINPFDHGSALHTDVMKTQGLKQALDKYQFDVAFGGARRDEEKSRAKERVFSFRTDTHRWDPKNQRPELWNLYNGHKNKGESIRVFPLSNWTELDIWEYIYREEIPIVPLYFAAERPVVERDGTLIMVDDDRMRMFEGEKVEIKRVRFRTLGCYPLTGAFESDADDLPSIVLELLQSRSSERQGRAIDSDSSASMEKKKQEGYF